VLFVSTPIKLVSVGLIAGLVIASLNPIALATLPTVNPPRQLAIPIEPQDGKPLTLPQAIALALANNPQWQANQKKLAISQANQQIANARLNPHLVSDNGLAEKTYRLGLQQTIELGGKRAKRLALATTQTQSLQQAIATEALTLTWQVKQAYALLTLNQQRLQATATLLKTAQQLVAITQRQEQAGDVAPLDVLQAQMAYLTHQNQYHETQTQEQQALLQLNALLHQPLTTHWQLAEVNLTTPLTTTPIETLMTQALAQRPDYHQSQLAETEAQQALKLAQAERIPNVTLTAGPDLVTQVGETGRSKQLSAFVMGSVELPLFNQQQGAIAQAQAKRQQAIAQQQAIKAQVALQLASAQTSLAHHLEHLTSYKTHLLPQAQVILTKSQRSFEVGKAPIMVPLNAQQTLATIQLGYFNTLSEAHKALADLEQALGTKAGLPNE
jgi:outer membrane protein, heavy metal efflux system